MTWLRQHLRDLREGVQILVSREWWRMFAAYWHPDAITRRINAWVERNRDR